MNFLRCLSDAEESQLEGPKNELSVVGSNVALKCSPPSRNCNGIEWLKFGVSGSVFNDLGIISSAYRDRYSVDNSSGCDLVIRNVEHTDAGRFICRAIISSNTVDGTAYLIILSKLFILSESLIIISACDLKHFISQSFLRWYSCF